MDKPRSYSSYLDIAISDLKVGDKVTVSYTEEGGKTIAHKITHAEVKKKTEKKPAPKKGAKAPVKKKVVAKKKGKVKR